LWFSPLGGNAVALGEAQGNFKHSRQHVHVLVTIEMCGSDAGIDYLLNLTLPFELHFF
jgi:hypothetical protein